MEICPSGLLSVTRLFLMSTGHSYFHKKGGSRSAQLDQVLPVPMPQESLYPIYDRQSLRYCLRSDVRILKSGSLTIAICIGLKNP
jgi:hypothetical protein